MHRPITLVHRTTYRYERPVLLGPQIVRLRPRHHPLVPAPGFAMEVDPAPASLHWLLDACGNAVARLGFAGLTDRLAITVRLELDLRPHNPFDFLLDRSAVQWPISYATADAAVLAPFLQADPAPALLAIRAETVPGQETIGLVLALANTVRGRVAYVIRDEPGVWEPERTLAEGQGSCRDSAWLLVQLLRLHGIAARFVSGYLVQFAEAGTDSSGEAELHAWAEFFLAGAGWIGIDATSALLVAEGHVALAVGAGPVEASPVLGTLEPVSAVLETSTTLAPRAA